MSLPVNPAKVLRLFAPLWPLVALSLWLHWSDWQHKPVLFASIVLLPSAAAFATALTRERWRLELTAEALVHHTLGRREHFEWARMGPVELRRALWAHLLVCVSTRCAAYAGGARELGDRAAHPRRVRRSLRHASWWNERVYAAFRDAGIIFCSCSGPKLPDVLIKTAPEIYVRFHGATRWYRHNYTKPELQVWADRIAESGAERVWAYFNNDRDCHAISNARTLKRLLNRSDAESRREDGAHGRGKDR